MPKSAEHLSLTDLASGMKAVHFISDLHLSATTPRITERFLAYLDGPARTASALFVLGDLFDAWPGDDCLESPDDGFNQQIAVALRCLSQDGVSLNIMRGNRDFLLGAAFASATGAHLVDDPFLLDLGTYSFVLAHGDALCTDDTPYQEFRAQVRSPSWQRSFLARPLVERKAIANALRQQSEVAKREKLSNARQYEMDVSETAVERLLADYDFAPLIHGHTHRPRDHYRQVGSRSIERHVLADWRDDRGEYLLWNGDSLNRCPLP